MKNNIFRMAAMQSIVSIASAAAAYFLVNPLAAESLLCGACASLANGIMLAWRIREKVNAENRDPGWHLRGMYRSSLERYAAVVLLLAGGMKLFGFAPLYVLAGFVAGQAGLVAAQTLHHGFENE